MSPRIYTESSDFSQLVHSGAILRTTTQNRPRPRYDAKKPSFDCSKDGPEFPWLPGADNWKNFFARFTFCPESLKRRAKHGVAKECREHYRHPLTLAYEFQELLEAGVVNNRAEIARQYGLSRARVTQVISLLRLPDEIQEYVIALPPREQRLYSGRRLQEITTLVGESAQFSALEDLASRFPGSGPAL